MSKVVYILSNNRSGSTLLDQLLGAHPKIMSLGEVQHLPAYARQDRTLYNPAHPLDCSCGQPLASCPFWTAVADRLGRPLESLQLDLRFLKGGVKSGEVTPMLRLLLKRIVRRRPGVMRNALISCAFGGRKLGSDAFALFDAVAGVTGADYIVDSSKGDLRYRALYNYSRCRVRGILLVRDYRGVVYSKMKRGRNMEATAREWAARVHRARNLTKDIPSRDLISLKYEDLCRNPRLELSRLCRFLDLEFTETMLTRPAEQVHHLGGSPSKFDSARRSIQLDETYREEFTNEQLARMREIVGSAALLWGYD